MSKFYQATVSFTNCAGGVNTVITLVRHENGMVFFKPKGCRKERFLCLEQNIINESSEATTKNEEVA